MYSKNNISKNTFLTNNAIFDGSRYDTKIEEETFCKLFIGKESENLVKNNELEMQVFETDKMSIYESSKNIIKLDINKTKENILDKKNIINIEKNDDYDNRNSNNINKIIVQGTFSLYHEGQAVFVSTDDVIFKMPIPIVGNKLNKGQKYEFKFNRKNTVSDKMNNINKIVSKYLIS